MIPPACELFRALLRRALGGRSVLANLVMAAAAGGVGGWMAAGYLREGLGERPSAGLVAWLLVNFQHTAMYGLGMLGALQLAAAYGDDARTGWTVQYLAAGGTRDRYILALAAASACAGGLLYLLAVSVWLAAATAFGRPVALLPASTAFLPVALLWLWSPAAFAAAAMALAARPGRAVCVMAGILLMPWLLLAALGPDPALGPPSWLPWTAAASPPYPADRGMPALCIIIAYSALLLATAWALAPRRLLRV